MRLRAPISLVLMDAQGTCSKQSCLLPQWTCLEFAVIQFVSHLFHPCHHHAYSAWKEKAMETLSICKSHRSDLGAGRKRDFWRTMDVQDTETQGNSSPRVSLSVILTWHVRWIFHKAGISACGHFLNELIRRWPIFALLCPMYKSIRKTVTVETLLIFYLINLSS